MNRPIYLDANIFITAFETVGERSDAAWSILDAVTSGSVRAQTSELTLAELLPKPLELSSELLVEIYMGLIKAEGVLFVAPVTRSILIKSAEVRATSQRARLPDAIHIATALETGCTAFVSDDRRIRLPASLALVCLDPNCLQQLQALAA